MPFIPAIQRPAESDGPALWFVFREHKLLTVHLNEGVSVPYVAGPSLLNVNISREQFLGTLDGRPCHCGECPPDAAEPDGMAFRGLRGLYGIFHEDLFWVAGRASQLLNWNRTHQYCGQCGTPTLDKTSERAKVCPACGLESFPRMSPAIIVAVIRGKEILLARSARFPQGLYSVLAGFVEPGEGLEECVRREVKEEVGIDARRITYFGSQPWPFPNSLMLAFTAEYSGGDIRIDGKEIVDAGWFSAPDLPGIPDKISIARRLIDWFVERHG